MYSSAVECMLSIREVLGSVPSTTEKWLSQWNDRFSCSHLSVSSLVLPLLHFSILMPVKDLLLKKKTTRKKKGWDEANDRTSVMCEALAGFSLQKRGRAGGGEDYGSKDRGS